MLCEGRASVNKETQSLVVIVGDKRPAGVGANLGIRGIEQVDANSGAGLEFFDGNRGRVALPGGLVTVIDVEELTVTLAAGRSAEIHLGFGAEVRAGDGTLVPPAVLPLLVPRLVMVGAEEAE